MRPSSAAHSVSAAIAASCRRQLLQKLQSSPDFTPVPALGQVKYGDSKLKPVINEHCTML